VTKKVQSPIDYRVRCESIVFHVNDLPFRFIRYGVQAGEVKDMSFHDITETFTNLSTGGRKKAIENERRYDKHFFTKGLGRHDEGLQGGSDPVRGAGPQEPCEGIRRYEGSETAANGNGSGDRVDWDRDDGQCSSGNASKLPCGCVQGYEICPCCKDRDASAEEEITLAQRIIAAEQSERLEKGD
jgi:hypothetical protein